MNNLLKSNFKLSLFELKYDTPEKRKVVHFKETALLDKFCTDLQRCLHVLYEIEKDPAKKISANQDVRKLIFKLNYEGGDKNIVESFYLLPLKKAFFKLRVDLLKLNSNGLDYVRFPLSENKEFLENSMSLVNSDRIAEMLLGNPILRDQLNFGYSALLVVKESPASEKLCSKDETMLIHSLPKFIIFKAMQHIRKVLDIRKKEDAKVKVLVQEGKTLFKKIIILKRGKKKRKRKKQFCTPQQKLALRRR